MQIDDADDGPEGYCREKEGGEGGDEGGGEGGRKGEEKEKDEEEEKRRRRKVVVLIDHKNDQRFDTETIDNLSIYRI